MHGLVEDGQLARHEDADAARNEILFGYDSDYAYAVDIIRNLSLGPGKPGPGDEWHVPRVRPDTAVDVASPDVVSASRPDGRFGRLARLFGRSHRV